MLNILEDLKTIPYQDNFKLRDYQDKMLFLWESFRLNGCTPMNELIENEIEGTIPNQRAMFCLPTGGGKSFIILKMAADAIRNGYRVLFLAHRNTLLQQMEIHFTQILKGFDFSNHLEKRFSSTQLVGRNSHVVPISVTSIDWLAYQLSGNIMGSQSQARSRVELFMTNWEEQFPNSPLLILTDEAHRHTDAYQRVYQRALVESPTARQSALAGFSGTPIRYSGLDLATVHQTLIPGPRVDQLIQLGQLSDYKYYSVDPEDIKKLWDYMTRETGSFDQTKISAYTALLEAKTLPTGQTPVPLDIYRSRPQTPKQNRNGTFSVSHRTLNSVPVSADFPRGNNGQASQTMATISRVQQEERLRGEYPIEFVEYPIEFVSEVMELPDTINYLMSGKIVDAYRQYNPQKFKTIVFAIDRSHAHTLAKEFNDKGIPAISLDSTMKKSEISEALADYVKGKYEVLVNVNLFSEGFDLKTYAQKVFLEDCQSWMNNYHRDIYKYDIPLDKFIEHLTRNEFSSLTLDDQLYSSLHDLKNFYEKINEIDIGCVMLWRPMNSLRDYRQCVGRVLRPCPSKDAAIIIDAFCIHEKLGLPSDPIDWGLNIKQSQRRLEIDESLMEIEDEIEQDDLGFESRGSKDAKILEIESGRLVRIPSDSTLNDLETQVKKAEAKYEQLLARFSPDQIQRAHANAQKKNGIPTSHGQARYGAWLRWMLESKPSFKEVVFGALICDVEVGGKPIEKKRIYAEWKAQGNRPQSIVQLKAIAKEIGYSGHWANAEWKRLNLT